MHNSDERIFSLKSAFAAGTHRIHKNNKQKLTACQDEPNGITDSLFDVTLWDFVGIINRRFSV